MALPEGWDDLRSLDLVRKCVAQELGTGAPLPRDEDDLVRTEVADSMAWVGILTAIEAATGIRNFGNPWPEGRPQSIGALADAIPERSAELAGRITTERRGRVTGSGAVVSVVGWGCAFGSRLLEAAEIERNCGLASGTIRDHAGIESVRQAREDEDEIVLAQQAADVALETAGVDVSEVDLLVATSTTFLRLPSLAATLHSRLLLPESCGALDVGGACVGVVQNLATAKALVAAGQFRTALVVASEVPSRRLASSSVPGEFRGLFGDGACALVLSRSESPNGRWKLGDFIWGCSGAFATSLQLELQESWQLRVEFQGEPLARAALSQLERLLQNLEMLARRPRSEVAYFALHEPNPRIVEILSRSAGIPLEKMAPISRTCGNLGAATCGVNLCGALAKAEADQTVLGPSALFVAGVGPGLLFGATYLERIPKGPGSAAGGLTGDAEHHSH
jgi:3-oxoacyl-[acyl-carrier-protein] synthase-3